MTTVILRNNIDTNENFTTDLDFDTNKQILYGLKNNIQKLSIQEPLVQESIISNKNTKLNLNLKKLSSEELLDKYGWKQEYSYFGVKFKSPLKFRNIIILTILHIIFGYSMYLAVNYERGAVNFWTTFLWGLTLTGIGGFGITAGAHRYWTHRSYKANLPMRILFAICYSAAGENPIPEWVRDHRVHHKYSETDADPHNSNRGFFFAHVGWLMMKKHPAVLERGKSIDMADIRNDSVVQFHTKHFIFMQLFFCFFLPTIIPVYIWNERWLYSFLGPGIMRYVIVLHTTWSVNSFAHLCGNKPYDKRMNTAQNATVSFLAMGEGWHNYHHAFPWDYKAAELPYKINVTTFWIDVFAKIGWVYDRKFASQDLIKSTSLKHGDGSHKEWGNIPDPDNNNI